jgi:sirohydrochlorin cobaltochelatase
MPVKNDDKRAPMASAPMKYLPDGRVDWGNMWDSFCVLALDGGPPHRGTMLPARVEVDPQSEGYRWAAAEICRGIEAVSGLKAAVDLPGWIAVACHSSSMATWLAEAITQENVQAQARGSLLLVPVAGDYTLTREIKNVITAVAKTTHYWQEHLPSEVKQTLAFQVWLKQFKKQLVTWLGLETGRVERSSY